MNERENKLCKKVSCSMRYDMNMYR